jgi:uncharacterized protein (TIGR04255 family)
LLPPITNVMVTVQFVEPLPNFNVIELGKLAERFLDRFPTFNQVNPAGPMPTNIAQLTGVEETRAPIANFPRLKFDTQDGQLTLLVQQDRMSCSWQRSPGDDGNSLYPGFETILDNLYENVESLSSYLGADLVPFAGEIAYTNYFKTSSSEGKVRLSSIFSLIEATDDPINMNGFTFSWNEILDRENGTIQVTIGAPPVSPIPEAFALLELTGIKAFDVEASLKDNFLSLRMDLRKSFHRIVNSSFRGEGSR